MARKPPTISAWTQAEQTFQAARTRPLATTTAGPTPTMEAARTASPTTKTATTTAMAICKWARRACRCLLQELSLQVAIATTPTPRCIPGLPEQALGLTTTATERLTPVKKRPPRVQKTSTPTELCRWPMCWPSCLSLAARQDAPWTSTATPT